MKKRNAVTGMGRYDSEECQREQALCRAALDSDAFDELTDRQWVAMCEQAARAKGQEDFAAAMPHGAAEERM